MRYLIRYSEIGTKAVGTRRRFLRQLQRNIKDGLARNDMEGHVETTLARGYVTSEDKGVLDVLVRIFGVQSVSPVHSFRLKSLDDVLARGEQHFKDAVAGKQFAVRARRVGNHEFTSQDIERQLGAALLPHAAGVRLNDPEVTASVEIRDRDVSFFLQRQPGPGGLPLGSQGRALVLLSGGFDSAVAAWEMMKRGVGVDYLFFNLGGPIHEEGVLRVVNKLMRTWQYGDNASIVVVPFMPMVEAIRKYTKQSYWNLVLKRAMLVAAAQIAEDRHLLAIVTGDAVGQVSSQTLPNLHALGDVGLPVLRPLLTQDKDDIVMRARHVGTEKLSAAVDEYCAIVPRHPVTSATREGLDREWGSIPDDVLLGTLSDMRALNLRSLKISETSALGDVARDDIPDNALLIDVREPEEFAEWHAKDAKRLDIHEAMRQLDDLPKNQPVLFVCEHGLLSAELAFMARERGVDASSFNGGIAALRSAMDGVAGVQ